MKFHRLLAIPLCSVLLSGTVMGTAEEVTDIPNEAEIGRGTGGTVFGEAE